MYFIIHFLDQSCLASLLSVPSIIGPLDALGAFRLLGAAHSLGDSHPLGASNVPDSLLRLPLPSYRYSKPLQAPASTLWIQLKNLLVMEIIMITALYFIFHIQSACSHFQSCQFR